MKNSLHATIIFVLYLLLVSNAFSQVSAWGLNDFGQLGNGNMSPQPLPVNIGQTQITGISGGLNHTVALQGEGTLLAWGNNNLGKLGNNSTIDSTLPVSVQNLTNVVAVAAGENHSLALKSDGTVWVWGSNGFGQQGNGSTDFDPHPLPVQVLGLTDVVAISAHLNHNIVLKSDGTVWAWGNNNFGQIGNNTSGGNVTTPLQVTGLSNIISVVAGFQHNAALKSDGSVWVWGRNAEGQIGNNTINTTGCQCQPIPQQTTISGVAQITAGFFNTAAVMRNGDVYIWGNNNFGQIGDNTVGGNVLLPAQTIIANVIELKMRGYHVLARINDGSVKAWGYNGDGEIGDGTITNTGCLCQPLPVSSTVGGGNAFINAGYFHGFSAKPQIQTNNGLNQMLFGDKLTLNFNNVTVSGSTDYFAIDPTTTGLTVPFGYTIQANQPAYDVSTSAMTSGNIDVCIEVPNEFSPTQFALLKVLHGEAGAFVDRTVSTSYSRRQICARVTSLSPFVIALGPSPTASNVIVGGRVVTDLGIGVSRALVSFTDEHGEIRTARTNSFGFFNFDSVPIGQTFVFSVSAKGLTFESQVVTLNDEFVNLTFTASNGDLRYNNKSNNIK